MLGLLPMGVLGALSWVVLRLGDGRTSGIGGLVLGVAAAPGLLVAGVPFADRSSFPLAISASALLWLLLGLLASRRATMAVVASWRDYWREMTWMTVAVVVGSCAALAAAAALMAESLLG